MARRSIPNTPALTVVFYVIGALCLLAGGGAAVLALGTIGDRSAMSLMAALPGAVGLIVFGIIYFGVGQVIKLIARIAQESARAADAAEQTAAASVAPMHVKALYFYQVGGEVRGPVSMADLRTIRSLPAQTRMVTGETLVCQQGSDEWKRLAEAMS